MNIYRILTLILSLFLKYQTLLVKSICCTLELCSSDKITFLVVKKQLQGRQITLLPVYWLHKSTKTSKLRDVQ